MHKITSALIATLAAGVACAANSFTWPQLPEGALPDTEVSTNVVLHINSQKLERFTLSLETTCCTSNEVLVAIGCDSDGNGDLSFEEADLAFGTDCGERYLADYRTQGRLLRTTGRHSHRSHIRLRQGLRWRCSMSFQD